MISSALTDTEGELQCSVSAALWTPHRTSTHTHLPHRHNGVHDIGLAFIRDGVVISFGAQQQQNNGGGRENLDDGALRARSSSGCRPLLLLASPCVTVTAVLYVTNSCEKLISSVRQLIVTQWGICTDARLAFIVLLVRFFFFNFSDLWIMVILPSKPLSTTPLKPQPGPQASLCSLIDRLTY